MSQIFLYTKGAKIGNETRKQLREAGIVPVEVESLDSAKLLSTQPLEIDSGTILRCAMETIRGAVVNANRNYAYDVGRSFSEKLASALAEQPK